MEVAALEVGADAVVELVAVVALLPRLPARWRELPTVIPISAVFGIFRSARALPGLKDPIRTLLLLPPAAVVAAALPVAAVVAEARVPPVAAELR